MAYGKRSPLPKLKNTNAIDDVKSALKKKDIKITGAMGSELRAKQYKEKGWAMDNTIGSAQGGTYEKPTVPTGKFGSDLRRKEYEANNWGGDATTKGNMPGSKTGGGGNTGGSTTTGGGTTGGGTNKPQSLQSIAESGKYKFDGNNQMVSATQSLTSRIKNTLSNNGFGSRGGRFEDGKFKYGAKSYTERVKDNIVSGRHDFSKNSSSADSSDFQSSNTNMMNASTTTSTSKNPLEEYIKNERKNQSKTKNSAEAPKKPRNGSDKTANREYQKELKAYKRKTAQTNKKSTTVAEPKKPKYSTEGKSGKQLRRTNRANKYNRLAKKAFDAGDTQEANRLIREEASVSKKIDRTKKRRDERRERRLEKAQAKVKKYTK